MNYHTHHWAPSMAVMTQHLIATVIMMTMIPSQNGNHMTKKSTQLWKNDGANDYMMLNEEDINKLEENNALEHSKIQGASVHANESANVLGVH